MVEMTVSRDVAAPADKVWAVLTDIEGTETTLTGVHSVERLDGGAGFDIGTKWQETRTLMRRESTAVIEVTALDPGRSYTWESEGKGVHYEGTVSVEPSGSGARLTMIFGGEPDGMVTRILTATIGKLFEGSSRRTLQRDLDDIAAAAEAS